MQVETASLLPKPVSVADFVSSFADAARDFTWSDACLIHRHIPRTGGTSIRQAITRHLLQRYSPSQIFLLDCGVEYDCANGSLSDFKALGDEERARIRFIGGHVPPEMVSLVPHPVTFTVLRDPVEHAISQYWFCFHDPTSGKSHQAARSLSIYDFVNQGFAGTKNGQALFLSGAFFTRERMSEEKLLESARRSLSEMTYACTLEDASELLSDICVVAGVNRVEDLPRLHQGRRLRQTTPEELALIASYNQVDRELYESVRKRR